MSDVTYPMISGTGVLQDFVELPSQLTSTGSTAGES
jgi:Zn-dependent oligopeptidase